MQRDKEQAVKSLILLLAAVCLGVAQGWANNGGDASSVAKSRGNGDARCVASTGNVAECVATTGGGFASGGWRLPEGAKIEGSVLTVRVGENEGKPQRLAMRTVEKAGVAGYGLRCSIRAKAVNVSKPGAKCNGIKFMLPYFVNDERQYPGCYNESGTFDWKTISFNAYVPAWTGGVELALGLQDASGEVAFDLATLKIEQMFPIAQASDYQCRYTEEFKKRRPLGGEMSPQNMTAEDFDTLAKWGVKLLRFQISREVGKSDVGRDLAEYDRWLVGRLDHLAWVLDEAQRRGIMVVIDLHSVPGGQRPDQMHAVFDERIYGEKFVEVWRGIARRFKGHPAVWGYDLFNEPNQIRPAKYCDYWNLQRRAAEAIREIDPETPIIVESNQFASPWTFWFMRPLELTNIVYQAHMYAPLDYTHQGVFAGMARGPRYPDPARGLDAAALERSLDEVVKFQQRHGAAVYVGEFSAVAWAEGAGEWLRDVIAVCRKYGWWWTHHAFREWEGWSVEYEGEDAKSLRPSPDNDRKRALLEGLSRR